MLLTLVTCGIRPSCLCADGTLCLVCPKLLKTSAPSSTQPRTTRETCVAHSCCRGRASHFAFSDQERPHEQIADRCETGGCLVLHATDLVIVETSQTAASLLEHNAAWSCLSARDEMPVAAASHFSRRGFESAGPPPDLIVLYQRWLI